jgi:hypothetical protein
MSFERRHAVASLGTVSLRGEVAYLTRMTLRLGANDSDEER